MIIKTFLICLICFMFTLYGCSVNKSTNTENDVSKIEEQNSKYSDTAKLVMTEFLNYYEFDWSELEDVGEEEISGKIYYTYKYTNKDFDGYTYYVLLSDNDESIYGGYPNSGLDLLWFNGKPADDEEFDSTPYIPYKLDIIGDSFESYKNRVGGYFNDITVKNPTYCADIKRYDGISYYLGTDGSFVAVDDGIIVAIVIPTYNNYSATSSVRELITDLNMTEMFEIAPEIKNVYDNVEFLFTWRADNGYIGITNAGSSNPQWYYGNTASTIILFEDKMHCSVYAEE